MIANQDLEPPADFALNSVSQLKDSRIVQMAPPAMRIKNPWLSRNRLRRRGACGLRPAR